MLPPVRGLLETTFIDWEGRLAAEVFLGGCNFRCPFCHARHLVLGDEDGESIPIDAVDACVERQEGWIDGIIISGGEPCLQPQLGDFVDHFRRLGLAVKLDTNGSRPEILARLIESGAVDAVSMDVKGPLDQRYHAIAGVEVDLEAIRSSIELLIGGNIEYEFRTTVCPSFHDDDAMDKTGLAVRGAQRYVLQRFRPVNCLDPAFNEVEPYTDEQMRRFADMVRKYVVSCQVRGDQESAGPS